MEVLPPSRGNGANQKSRAFHTNECPSATRGSGRPDGPPPVLFTRIRGSVSNISAVRARRPTCSPLIFYITAVREMTFSFRAAD